jgi:hypothetical protein
VNGFVWRRIEM